jgi:hypothetical protein
MRTGKNTRPYKVQGASRFLAIFSRSQKLFTLEQTSVNLSTPPPPPLKALRQRYTKERQLIRGIPASFSPSILTPGCEKGGGGGSALTRAHLTLATPGWQLRVASLAEPPPPLPPTGTWWWWGCPRRARRCQIIN